jgi:hypothetical protein
MFNQVQVHAADLPHGSVALLSFLTADPPYGGLPLGFLAAHLTYGSILLWFAKADFPYASIQLSFVRADLPYGIRLLSCLKTGPSLQKETAELA